MKTRARQQEFGFTRWGGKRRGAGRKPKGERAGVSHAARPRLAPRYPVLVTLRLRAGLASLRAKDEHELVRNALAASTRDDFRVIEYSVQSNHVHALVEASDETALTRGMTGLAVRLARRLNELWKRAGKVLSDRYHARILRSPREVRNALVYVLQNARKHHAWIARREGRNVAESSRTAESNRTARSSPGVLARARTWLLAVGWRRLGLIGLLELPRGAVEPLQA